jgi:2-polyprenyl-3-methyl-5-hydroxy-6-metoxy-1,4-benzoquinol methylase
VKRPSSPEARRAIALFGTAPRGDRFHVRMRWWTCPFDAVEQAVPKAGRVLEVGCGHGLLSLYLAVCSPARQVMGIDIDADKIAIAQAAADQLASGGPHPSGQHVQFDLVDPDRFPDGEFDAVVFCDVLYLLPVAARRELLDRAIVHVAPGGLVIVKEADQVPRWKSRLATGQELLATRVLRITEGDQVEFASPAEFAEQLGSAGLEVTQRRVDRGYPHPHVLVAGRRRAAG